MQKAGCRIAGYRYWMQDAGCWIIFHFYIIPRHLTISPSHNLIISTALLNAGSIVFSIGKKPLLSKIFRPI